MSIILKGIDLPKDAQAIQISYWTKDGHYIAESYPPSRIVEIPTPHGRLIDEDEIFKRPHCGECNDATLEAIEYAPTILEEEK